MLKETFGDVEIWRVNNRDMCIKYSTQIKVQVQTVKPKTRSFSE